MAETIAVLSLKGGTGKTTTVRTLADVFRRIGLDVLCVDLDPQGNLSDYFDVPADATPTVADVLSGDAKAKAATHDGIIPATPILAEVERGLSGKIGRELVLRKALKDARKQHDIILDRLPAGARPADDQRARRRRLGADLLRGAVLRAPGRQRRARGGRPGEGVLQRRPRVPRRA